MDATKQSWNVLKVDGSVKVGGLGRILGFLPKVVHFVNYQHFPWSRPTFRGCDGKVKLEFSLKRKIRARPDGKKAFIYFYLYSVIYTV